MKERLNLFATSEEKKILEEYCKKTGRSMTDVVRELIRGLKDNIKPS